MSEYGGPDWADYHSTDPREQFWDEKSRNYPRGHGPAWQGEDAPSELGFGDLYTDDEHPDPYGDHIADPGFPEYQVDVHHDPDHGREDRIGAILRQSEQFPHATGPDDHCSLPEGHYDDYDKWANDADHQMDTETSHHLGYTL